MGGFLAALAVVYVIPAIVCYMVARRSMQASLAGSLAERSCHDASGIPTTAASRLAGARSRHPAKVSGEGHPEASAKRRCAWVFMGANMTNMGHLNAVSGVQAFLPLS